MGKLEKFLEELSEDEIEDFVKSITKLIEKQKSEKKSKQKQPLTHNIREGKSSRRQRKKTEQPSELEQHRASRRKSKKSKGSPSRREPVQTRKKRVNLFETMKFTKKEQQELEKAKIVDQKLQVGWIPSERARESDLVEVICRDCGKKEIISFKMCPQEADRYRCNRCSQTGSND